MNDRSIYSLVCFLVLVLSVIFPGCVAPPASITTPPTSIPQNTITPSDPQNKIRLKVGDKAPEFSLMDIKDGMVSLSHFAPNKVVINIWWLRCHGCIDEMQYLQEFYENWNQQGLALLAINVYDTISSMRDFATKNGITFTLLFDAEKTLNAGYTDAGVPTTFFIDGQGIIRAIQDGAFKSSAEIEKIYQSY